MIPHLKCSLWESHGITSQEHVYVSQWNSPSHVNVQIYPYKLAIITSSLFITPYMTRLIVVKAR